MLAAALTIACPLAVGAALALASWILRPRHPPCSGPCMARAPRLAWSILCASTLRSASSLACLCWKHCSWQCSSCCPAPEAHWLWTALCSSNSVTRAAAAFNSTSLFLSFHSAFEAILIFTSSILCCCLASLLACTCRAAPLLLKRHRTHLSPSPPL
jgi:hypothetical protein